MLSYVFGEHNDSIGRGTTVHYMLKISAVYLIGKYGIHIHYTTWAHVEQAFLNYQFPIDGHLQYLVSQQRSQSWEYWEQLLNQGERC